MEQTIDELTQELNLTRENMQIARSTRTIENSQYNGLRQINQSLPQSIEGSQFM